MLALAATGSRLTADMPPIEELPAPVVIVSMLGLLLVAWWLWASED